MYTAKVAVCPEIRTKHSAQSEHHVEFFNVNPLAPSDPFLGRAAQLTSRRFILNTYSTNIRTEYFKRAA
jgi:hypothetical protein